MASDLVYKLLETAQPRGLNRLVLAVLALAADATDHVSFTEANLSLLARRCSMQDVRFLRNVRELESAGFVRLEGSSLVVYDGGHGGLGQSPQQEQASLLPADQHDPEPEGGVVRRGTDDPRRGVQREVDEVLAHYVDVMQPREATFGEEERREVRAALKVRSVEKCKEAISGNKASAYHQGENERGKKYNGISHIFRGKRGRRTRAENIDMFIDIFRKAKVAGTVRSAVDPAIVATKKEEVRRAHRLRDDDEAIKRGAEAEAWLREQGVETRRLANGYPVFPEEPAAETEAKRGPRDYKGTPPPGETR